MIAIDLSAPARVNGQLAAPQSLWLLLRLWLAATQEKETGGWLHASQLRERFGAVRNPRMMVSRAFAHFAAWGVAVGWGSARTRPIKLLSLAGRNRGPYWLAPGQAELLQISIGAQPASVSDVLAWLADGDGEIAPPSVSRSALPAAAGAPYWHAWAAAKEDVLAGRLLAPADQGALAGYRRAQALASDPYFSAMAQLQQAMVWRRAGNADAALQSLALLERSLDVLAPEHAWLGAMAAIVAAWCAYSRRDLAVAQKKLNAAAADPRWSAAFKHHPRVRAEHANLQALMQRAVALDETAVLIERERAANDAVANYQLALTLANEAELFDAAAAAASNLGWSVWLFARARLRLNPAPQTPPLQWIALAAWLNERHPTGACWNTIYLLRMLREGGPEQLQPALEDFMRWPVLSPAAFRAVTAPIALNTLWRDWREPLAQELAAVDAGQVQIDALQLANLLLEQTWYAAHAGDLKNAVLSAARLRRRLRELSTSDRPFFRTALKRLPVLDPA